MTYSTMSQVFTKQFDEGKIIYFVLHIHDGWSSKVHLCHFPSGSPSVYIMLINGPFSYPSNTTTLSRHNLSMDNLSQLQERVRESEHTQDVPMNMITEEVGLG